ncbi:MAG: cysteine--tRNA ligase [Phycisphaerae bacterium]|nr:cysteine--tRNA ligase [Phycisphaerae bacterium]
MAVTIYNALTRRKEPLEPVEPGRIGIYLCGPTVYKKSHIGHGVGPVIFDAIRRWLEQMHGYQVTLVLNVTDVEDKLIDEAKAQGRPMLEIAEEITTDYLKSVQAMNVRMPTYMPKATEHIAEIIGVVGRLIDRGYAYQVDGDVYFDVTRCEGYGKLSGRSKEEQEAGTREVAGAEGKRHAWDFALWKSAKPDEPSWDSPWGKGRPGWHIECTAMSMKYLGETFDIHGGGRDLVFPHHENEIAQSECATGKPFAKYWVHHGLTRVDQRKMSKSLGNIRTLESLLSEYPGEVLRFFILSTHYRRPIDFSDEEIRKVRRGMQTFYRLFDRVARITGQDVYALAAIPAPVRDEKLSEAAEGFVNAIDEHRGKLVEAMNDDFNTAEAIASLYEMAHAANSFIEAAEIGSDSPDEEKRTLLTGVQTLRHYAMMLGLFEQPPQTAVSDELTGSLMELLIEVRASARQAKQYAIADRIRDRLVELGVQLKDTKEGTTWERASQ